jgi:hypothetical protein
VERHGLAGRWAYWDAINDVYHGLPREQVRSLYAEADGLINLCGATQLREEHLRCPVRIMIDTDPVYEQIKYAQADPAARAYVDAHTHFFTYGANLGSPECAIPLSGVPWRATRPPVDLDLWPEPSGGSASDAPPCFTTIATWENKGKNIDFDGNSYLWSKHTNFLEFLDLPRQRPQTCFRMAMLPPDEAVRRTVEGAGWGLVDPRPVSAGMDPYREFIAGSRGEFTVAKDIYVRPNSGWFSDRAVSIWRRPAGRDDAHRLHDLLPGRARLVRLRQPGRGARRDRCDRRRLYRPQPRRPRPSWRLLRSRAGHCPTPRRGRPMKRATAGFSGNSA